MKAQPVARKTLFAILLGLLALVFQLPFPVDAGLGLQTT